MAGWLIPWVGRYGAVAIGSQSLQLVSSMNGGAVATEFCAEVGELLTIEVDG